MKHPRMPAARLPARLPAILPAVLAALLGLATTNRSNAETLQFTGTFGAYIPVGVAVDLTGVTPDIATWPAYDSDQSTPGLQILNFAVSGSVDVTNGVVTGAVINQMSPLVNDYEGPAGITRGTFSNISWTYTGGSTMGFTPGRPAGVTGTCVLQTSSGSPGCASALTALQTDVRSAWTWQSIPANFLVSDLFGVSGVLNLNIGGPTGRAGVTWTVTGNQITADVAQGLAGVPTAAFNSVFVGTFTLQTVAAPTAVDDGPISAAAGVPVPIIVLANDVGFADPVTVTLGTLPAKGTAQVNGSPGNQAAISVTYTASIGEVGEDSFTYTVTDGASTDTATVTLNLSPDGANNDAASTTRNTPVNISVGANDVGFGGTVNVTIENGSFSAGGSASVTAGQGGPPGGVVVTYTPVSAPGSPSYSETFSYTIDDGVLPPEMATVTVSVVNEVPVAAAGTISSIATGGVDPATRTGTFTAPGTGGNLGNSGTVTITAAPARGAATVTGAVISYRPDTTFFTGSDAFTYTITDADGESSAGQVTVTIANVAPTISDGRLRTNEDTASAPLTLTIARGNGASTQHTLAVTSQAANGSCVVSPGDGTGRVVYTPAAGYFGTDSCVVTLTDGDGEADTGVVSISVDEVVIELKNGSSALDPLSILLLGGLPLLRRRRN